MSRRRKAEEALEVLESLGYKNCLDLVSDNSFITRIQKDIKRIKVDKSLSSTAPEEFFNISLMTLRLIAER